jgi:uncharacterized protein (TIGR02246 family)
MRDLTILFLLTVSFAYTQDAAQAPTREPSRPSSTAISFKNTVQQKADEWLAAFQAKDAEKIASMYTDDAVWINPEGTFHGSGRIKDELKKMLDRGDTVSAIPTAKAVRSGDLAWAEGTYTGTIANPKGGEPLPGNGSWVTTLKNVNGKWMLATHTSVPAAVPRAMAKSTK